MTFCRFDEVKTILCLGAHSDDIEIGCGGTLLTLLRANPRLEVWWVVFTANGKREKEAKASARDFLAGAGKSKVIVKQFRNGFFPAEFTPIKEFFETLKNQVQPDLVFTHYREDRHQDHRVLSDLAWNTFRHHTILEYEIPKYDGDLGAPNFFSPISETVCDEKVQLLMKHFATQQNKHWFSEDLFRGLLRVRGIEAASAERHAEAFYARKLLLGTGGSQ
jgi:LmbE family N-acetylglucosaminyl deacetylase